MVRCGWGILLLMFLYTASTWADEAEDLGFFIGLNSPQNTDVNLLSTNQGVTNITAEWSLLGIVLIRFYQKFISTQDQPVCQFTPTCSRFGAAAIQRCGILRGMLLTSDRLMRCHGVGFERHYPLDVHSGGYLDPVERYLQQRLGRGAP